VPRIPLFPLEYMTAEQRRVYDDVVSGPRGRVEGPLRAALHRPDLADKWQQLGAALRYGTSLPPRLSELVILLTARAWDSQFEWYAHEPHALKAGLAREALDAIRTGDTPVFGNDDEQAVHDYVIELQQTHAVSESTYQRALTLFGVIGVVELTALTGYYSMVAMTLNAHQIPLPAGAEPPLPARSS
jgi:4-carboxymuconolactone decarboxylase